MCAPFHHVGWSHHYCLHCHPRPYIRLVQHLIEKCLTFHMDRNDCVRALAKHASIHPVVTMAVWDELLKENPEFFCSYFDMLHGRLRRAPLKSQKYCKTLLPSPK